MKSVLQRIGPRPERCTLCGQHKTVGNEILFDQTKTEEPEWGGDPTILGWMPYVYHDIGDQRF
jgi:hypothetical protein